ncbi:hypothetical protein ACFQOY_12860 [Enterococcus alcedinis]|uniref:Uncharacterized protein n=1 Tax=Enterococcus alcedinis TaxID=1274384 RepID=A0A917N3P0_9ENTE|nr:hypothetical protein [Enterococcus alcedinis]MBP2100807.1 hypothetical protein [Enterococcus alcedinis]GGI64895.1 hypothetical protein GCM10011482_05490 [Enterococcus alcedinis]
MSKLTMLLLLFTILLYTYLFLVRKEIVFFSKRQSSASVIYPCFLVFVLIIYYTNNVTLDKIFQGLAMALIVLSYLFNVRGIANQRIILHSYQNKGIMLEEINHVIIIQDTKKEELRINFFRYGLRLPMVKFDQSLEELLQFLSKSLEEDTEIDIIITEM